MVAFFESMEVSAMDVWTLFLTLDVDGDHTVGWQVSRMLQDAPGPCSTFGQSDSIHILLVVHAFPMDKKALSARVKRVNLPLFQLCCDFNSKSFCRC